MPGPAVDLVAGRARGDGSLGQRRARSTRSSVPLSAKGDLLAGATARDARGRAPTWPRRIYQIWDTRKWFVSSRGHRIDQHIRECGAGISATVVGDGETQRRSYPSLPRASTAPAAGSWSTSSTCPAHAARIADEARALLTAPLCPAGETTLILGSEQMALQIHESVGHAIELDRILGWEAAFAGTSWLDLAQLGSLRYGSELMNITIDPTIPGALGSLRLRRRGHAGAPRGRRPRRHLGRRARRPRLGGGRRARLRAAACAPTAGPGCRWSG